MDLEKANDILESAKTVEVQYSGFPVWIESLAGDSAEVRYLETGERIRVPVAELVEGGSV